MNVKQLSEATGLSVLTMPTPEREVKGVYIGDLLSWVMGRAAEANAWITIMSNTNIVAVATLADTSCIILAEGVTPDEGVLTTAEQKGINILSSPLAAYDVAKELYKLNI